MYENNYPNNYSNHTAEQDSVNYNQGSGNTYHYETGGSFSGANFNGGAGGSFGGGAGSGGPGGKSAGKPGKNNKAGTGKKIAVAICCGLFFGIKSARKTFSQARRMPLRKTFRLGIIRRTEQHPFPMIISARNR